MAESSQGKGKKGVAMSQASTARDTGRQGASGGKKGGGNGTAGKKPAAGRKK